MITTLFSEVSWGGGPLSGFHLPGYCRRPLFPASNTSALVLDDGGGSGWSSPQSFHCRHFSYSYGGMKL